MIRAFINKQRYFVRATKAATSAVIWSLLLLVTSTSAWSLALPEDPSQSIRYWKPQVVAPDSDTRVALAHELFDTLLGAWDISRVEPALNVVRDSSGPWAASLADGNILLSQAAITTCLAFGKTRGKHLLAFILAHELAHQKGNDLWHQQFFRLIGNQSPERTAKIRRDLALDANHIAQLENLEAQADVDAVVMMASVGYDPYQIVKDQDFYTSWVENIWQQPCKVEHPACQQARQRALRTHAQLESISDQAVLYELGIQALVAKHYDRARAYLTAYARNFPGRAVHNSLGVSYLAQAIALWPEYAALTGKALLYFPLFVEAQPTWKSQQSQDGAGSKRGSAAQLKSRINTLAEKALGYFDKAQRLSPQHKKTHYLRALSYILMENSPMANGIVEGQYLALFSRDASSELLQALSLAIQGKTKAAQSRLSHYVHKETSGKSKSSSTARDSQLLYAMVHNMANLARLNQGGNKGERAAKSIWKNFANQMSKQGQGYLLQLALAQLRQTPPAAKHTTALSHGVVQLGKKPQSGSAASSKDIWFEGEPLALHRDSQGAWITDKQGAVIALWLHAGDFEGLNRLKLGDSADRIIRVMGPADRQIQLNSGQFLAYDQLGLALRVTHNKISSWFVYNSTD